jgi:hypothetical protein
MIASGRQAEPRLGRIGSNPAGLRILVVGAGCADGDGASSTPTTARFSISPDAASLPGSTSAYIARTCDGR